MDISQNAQLPFGAFIDQDHIWCQVLNRVSFSTKKPALFLDRDGVVVEEVNYLAHPRDVSIIHGARKLIRSANIKKIPVIIITNQ